LLARLQGSRLAPSLLSQAQAVCAIIERDHGLVVLADLHGSQVGTQCLGLRRKVERGGQLGGGKRQYRSSVDRYHGGVDCQIARAVSS
jgi:hypothetical protein